MALTQIFAPTLISAQVGPAFRRWPAGIDAVRFVLDDTQFTDPALSVQIIMDLSWDNKATWPYRDGPNTWVGGAKSRTGASPGVTLGPFMINDPNNPGTPIHNNPTHVRFFARPAPGSGPVTVGLLAEVSPDT